MAIIVSDRNRFSKLFTGKFLDKFAVKSLSKIPSLLACVATLACKTLMSGNERLTINYKVV